jgi:hypothetical protein
MGFLVKAVSSIFKAVGKVLATVIGGVFGFIVSSSKKKSSTAINNLNKTLEPQAFRKIVFGKTAAPLDVRYWETWANNTKYDEIIAISTHRINAVLEVYFEDVLGIDASGNVQSAYSGLVTRTINLGTVGQTALSAGAGALWTSSATFDGCAHIKFAWVPDDKKMPNGIPSRFTQVVEGALVYDPRRDSTVTGGSGTHRANDQTTWAYATLDGNGIPIGRNNALQALWYLLGWRIATKDAGGTVTGSLVVAGRGVDPTDIDMGKFIIGANACEVAGYYTDLILSTEDEHTTNEDKITCSGLIGRLIDPGGLWAYYANVDTTSSVDLYLTDADILQGSTVTWNEYKGMSDQYNQVGGKFINPSNISLYQQFPYPLVRDATYESNLGIFKRLTQDFEQVISNSLAQKLARLKLNELQYQGEFSASFMPRAMKAQAWSIVQYQSDRFGWTKLFRVWRHQFSMQGGVQMLLRETHPSIWTAGTVNAALTMGVGSKNDPSAAITLTGLTVAALAIVGSDGSIYDGFTVSWTTPPINVRRTEIIYRVVGSTNWQTSPPISRDLSVFKIGPLFSNTTYEVQARHVSINEIYGPWVAISPNFTTANTTNNLTAVNLPALNGNTDFQIAADNTGTITATLPFTRQFIAKQGTVDVSTTSTWALSGGYSALSLTVDSTGLVTVASGTTGNGTATLSATLPDGVILTKVLTFTKTNAPAGVVSTTTASINTNTANPGTTTSVISGEVMLNSNASSQVKISMDILFNGLGTTPTTTRGGALTDVFADTASGISRTNDVYISGDRSWSGVGETYMAQTTFTLPAANTPYYFKLKGRTNSGTIAITSTSINISQ